MIEERESEHAVDAALADIQVDSPGWWLEPIYRQHATAVLQTACRITGNPDDAEDVLHTVFERLARRTEPPDFVGGALPYLRRAATNAALDVVRSARLRSSVPINDAPPRQTADSRPAPDRLHASRQLATRIRDALATLKRRHAEMFVLRYLEGLDNQSIAEQFETSPGTVAVTLHRVRTRLAEELRQGDDR